MTTSAGDDKIPAVGDTTDRHLRLRMVFDEVLLMDPSERASYLDHACAGDLALRSDVMRLLTFHQRADSFLEHPLDLFPMARDREPFAGTDRFRVVRRLGAGGMGVVYEVHDELRDEVVALKTLLRTGAADLYRLKQEFRSLADVAHPNLVCLYELFVDAQQSFFTMELVDGVSFVEYVRGTSAVDLSVDRLRPALRQLIDGVSALHRRGKRHRDIKPSNVLVTPDGRVVILDFGLVAEALPERPGETRYTSGGTPAYMSPEEASGATPSEASDWYGVGVTLYEALTGRVPFEGPVAEVLARKQTHDPLTPSEVTSHHVPEDLSTICMGLLHRQVEQRLTGATVLRMLKEDGALPDAAAGATHDAPFVGRRDQLQALSDARAAGGARTVVVHGPSGIGKTALVRRFLGEVSGGNDVIVLTGRCYENESVPYKALDGVIDDLSGYLGSLLHEQVGDLLSADVAALTRLFPVLLRVDAVTDAVRQHGTETADPLRLRQRALAALAELFDRLAAHRPLLVWIDDLQWADADSIVLLEELLGAPRPPAMLTTLSFRSEEIVAKPFLNTFLERAGRHGWSAVALAPMTDDEADALIGGLIPEDALDARERRRLTVEASGSPFVLEQLALHAGTTHADAGRALTFAGMFESRLDGLAIDAQRFLDTLATCGRPEAPEVICDACGVTEERQSLVVRLRAMRLIRSSGSSARIETYHDRIRETLVGRLAPQAVRAIHGRMAESLVVRRGDDCEALFEHYHGAGNDEQASVQAARAAEKATAALAFDRAATFYGHALDLTPASPKAARWREALATALANAGRPADAADAYLRAASMVDRVRAVELLRRAAEQFLIGGHIDRGLDLIRRVLESVGLRFPASPRAALVSLIWQRLRLALRGMRFAPRTSDDVGAEALLRLDTCWAAAAGLALVDIISASDFIARYVYMALDAGEPSRVARGVALEAAARHADWTGRPGRARLAHLSKDLAARVGTPQAMAMDLLADSMAAVATGQWRRALTSSERTLAILRDQCVGVTWELNIAQNVYIWALMYLGELGDVSRRVPALLADGRRRGDLYLATELCTRSNFVWLAADEPDEGEREAMEAIARWSQKGFHRQHYSAMLARVQTALYRGDAQTAWRLLLEHEAPLRRSMLLRVQAIRIETLYLRARTALAVSSATPSSRRFLSLADDYARRIAREQMPWSNPLALLIQAGIAYQEARQALAVTRLEDAIAQFDHAEMQLYAAVARRRLGTLRADARGREIRAEADAWMAAQHIKNPTGMTRMFAPGFPD